MAISKLMEIKFILFFDIFNANVCQKTTVSDKYAYLGCKWKSQLIFNSNSELLLLVLHCGVRISARYGVTTEEVDDTMLMTPFNGPMIFGAKSNTFKTIPAVLKP